MNNYTEYEIDKIKKSCELVSDTLSYIASILKIGIKTIDLDSAAESYINERGGIPAFKGYMGFSNSLCISVNNIAIHGVPNDYIIKENDVVGIDCGIQLDGFYGDSAYTFTMVGDSDYSHLIRETKGALYDGINSAKCGNRTQDIGYAINKRISNAKLGNIKQYTGHGIGRNLHELPRIPNYGHRNMGELLDIGTVIAIEPMVSLGNPDVHTLNDGWSVATKDGSMAAHFEHTIAITNNGTIILTNHDGIESCNNNDIKIIV